MKVNPKQALALWRMLTAETDEAREPMWSKLRPQINPAERKELLQEGLVVSARRGRANHLILTQKAWEWAQASTQVELAKSAEGAIVLQSLLRRLLPYLEHRNIRLVDVMSDPSAPTSEENELPVRNQVLTCIRTLGQAAPAGGVRLVALRAALPRFTRESVDDVLLSLRKDGLILLYPDDDRASLTAADHEAALSEGGIPRHLVYLENR